MAETYSADDIGINPEFIKQNENFVQRPTKRKGGPYSKEERIKRQNEVYRLHFEYGYTARKIAELMKISRNTVNSDIDILYSQVMEKADVLDPTYIMAINLERLEVQRSRIRELIDKADSIQQKLALERLIYEIDSKILNTYSRLAESTRRVNDLAVLKLNRWMKENKKIREIYDII